MHLPFAAKPATAFAAIIKSEVQGYFRGHQAETDLVILDIIRPEMDGWQTFDLLKQLSEDVRVLLFSGCSIEGKATELLARGCRGTIRKSFSMAELSAKTREALG